MFFSPKFLLIGGAIVVGALIILLFIIPIFSSGVPGADKRFGSLPEADLSGGFEQSPAGGPGEVSSGGVSDGVSVGVAQQGNVPRASGLPANAFVPINRTGAVSTALQTAGFFPVVALGPGARIPPEELRKMKDLENVAKSLFSSSAGANLSGFDLGGLQTALAVATSTSHMPDAVAEFLINDYLVSNYNKTQTNNAELAKALDDLRSGRLSNLSPQELVEGVLSGYRDAATHSSLSTLENFLAAAEDLMQNSTTTGKEAEFNRNLLSYNAALLDLIRKSGDVVSGNYSVGELNAFYNEFLASHDEAAKQLNLQQFIQ